MDRTATLPIHDVCRLDLGRTDYALPNRGDLAGQPASSLPRLPTGEVGGGADHAAPAGRGWPSRSTGPRTRPDRRRHRAGPTHGLDPHQLGDSSSDNELRITTPGPAAYPAPQR